MEKGIKNEIIKAVKTICERKDGGFSEKKAEDLIRKIQSLWSGDHFGLDQSKAKNAIKEAIRTWRDAKSYTDEIHEDDMEKMAEAVFSKGESVKPKNGVFYGSLARTFVLPDVPHVNEVLAVTQRNVRDQDDYIDYKELHHEISELRSHKIGVRLNIDIFSELCSDPDSLLTIYKRLNSKNQMASLSITADRDYNSFYYSLKSILSDIYKFNLKDIQDRNRSPLTDVIKEVSKDVSKDVLSERQGLEYELSSMEAEELVSRIDDLFDSPNGSLSFDMDRLTGTLVIAAQRYISDKTEAGKVVDFIIYNPFENGHDDYENDDIYQIYKNPKTHADKVIEHTVPEEMGAAPYAFRLKGDLFADTFPRYFSCRSFLRKLWFKINDEYICGSKVYSHDYDEALMKFYKELAMVLQTVFKEDVEEELRKRISNKDEKTKEAMCRKNLKYLSPIPWSREFFTEAMEHGDLHYDVPNWNKVKEIFEKPHEADYLYHVIDQMSFESRCALFMVAKGYRPKKDKYTGKPISGGNKVSLTSSKEDRIAIANASESELIEYADKLKTAFYCVMNGGSVDEALFSPTLYFEGSVDSDNQIAKEIDTVVSDVVIAHDNRSNRRRKRYKAKDIYSLYREIALEFADWDESHVGIYHALYAIAYITEKMTLDELIFEVGDYDKAEDSEKNRRIITVCKNLRDFAYDVNKCRPENDRINLQTVLKVFPLYKDELNGNSEEGIMLSRELLSDFTEMAVDTLLNQNLASEIKSIDIVFDHSNYKLSSWEEAWKIVNEKINGDNLGDINLPEEFIGGSFDGRFWIESIYVMLYGIIVEAKIKPYRPLAIAIRYDPPAFDVLENIGDKNKGFIEAVESGEDYYTSLISGFTDQKGKRHERITGQDYALRKFIDAYEYALMYNKNPDRPLAVYLFVGPPGVGKTMLAENAAALFGRPFKRFDMSEYPGGGNDGTADVNGLIGFEKTWKGAVPGVLTTYVDEHPNAVLLFDEIEKAGKAVARIFLSILEGARLTDKYTEKTVSFSKTILMFTTNAGKDLYENNEDMDLSTIPDGAIIEALRDTNKKKEPQNAYDAKLKAEKHSDAFPPELVSRFATSNIIMFNHLDKLAFKGIAESGFKAIQDESRKSEEGLEVILDDERLSSAYMYSQNKLDARILSSGSRKFLGGKVRDALKTAKMLSYGGVKGLKIQFSVDIDNAQDKEIKNLFLPQKGQDVTENNILKALYVTDRKEQETLPKWLRKERVCTFDDFRQKIEDARDPFDMFIVDLSTGGNKDIYDNTAEGVRCLNEISDNPGNHIICVVTGKIKLSDLDKELLLKKGVSKFLPIDETSEEWENAASDTYIKKSLRMLADDGYVLGFDTDVKPPKNKTVQIRYTNFRYCEAEFEDADTRREDSQNLVSESSRPKVKFDDIIGADSAKQQLQDIIEYVKNPAKYEIMNCPAPRGLLLHGHPGTGKTMLAKALAGETKMAFIATTGSELASKGAEGVEYIFDLARRKRKAIIFIDEFDALGSVREGYQTNKEFAVNRLLTEMDGFSNDKKRLIFVVAATNAAYEDKSFGIDVKIDKAVERRFGKSLVIGLPLKKDRVTFIEKRLKDMNQSIDDGAISVAADLTGGKSLAVIESYLQNCIRHAIRDEMENVEEVQMTEERFLNYLQEELFGDSNEKKESEAIQQKVTKEEDPAYHTAIHEAGHALLSCLSGEEPAILTISGRGNYAGFYLRAEKKDDKIPTKTDLLNRVDVSLAGGVAETVIFGEDLGTTTGVSSDLENATHTVRNMITKYGMAVGKSKNIAVIRDDRLIDRTLGDTSLNKELLDEINSILHNEKEKTKGIIEKNKDILTGLADAVYDSKGKFLTGGEIKEICGKAKL